MGVGELFCVQLNGKIEENHRVVQLVDYCNVNEERTEDRAKKEEWERESQMRLMKK